MEKEKEKEKSEKSICSGDIDHTETPRPWQSFHTVYTNSKAGNPFFHTQPIIIIAILHTQLNLKIIISVY